MRDKSAFLGFAEDKSFARPEPQASGVLRRRIAEELGWECTVPEFRDEVPLYE